MSFNDYNDYELKFYIDIIDDVLQDYNNKVYMLENLIHEFYDELNARRS